MSQNTKAKVELNLGNCQCCDNEPGVGVAAIPGVPMSIVWGKECLRRLAYPLQMVDTQVGMNIMPGKGWDEMAPWFVEQETYKDGEYVKVSELKLETYDCWNCKAKGVTGIPPSSCEACGGYKKLTGVVGVDHS